MTYATMPFLRREALRDALQATVDSLHRRRASEIPEGYIDDYVSLNWLEWRGGGLKLTPAGEDTVAMPEQERSDLPKPKPAGAAPVSQQERAELARQGAKAAARGDPTSSNPMCPSPDGPDGTTASQALCTERRDAWLEGHQLQSEESSGPHTFSHGSDGGRHRK